jgi:MoaA/NifB/PqqE/SkfB family radical SAM enzyme
MSREHGRLVDYVVDLLSRSVSAPRRRAAEGLITADRDAAQRRLHRVAAGLPAPSMLFLSLTTRCGRSCPHCLAADYPAAADLEEAVADRLLSEAQDLGIFVCALTGGEPLLHPAVFRLAARHDRSLLLLFTSAAGLDESAANRIADLPHVLPVFGVEGGESVNERLRGDGATARSKDAMSLLRVRGVPFGFATTARRANLADLLGWDFYREMFVAGARFGILLDCLPVGRAAIHVTTLAPHDRTRLSAHLREVRQASGGFVAYVPGDEREEGGCQAATELLHVNALGQIEPCPFLHAASARGAETLVEALASPLFREVRRCAGRSQSTDPVPCWYLNRQELLRDVLGRGDAVRTDHPPLRKRSV